MKPQMSKVKVQRAILHFVICILTFGCTPQQQSYTPSAHPRAAVALGDTALVAADDTILPLKIWLPKHRPRAVIVALHGFNDYSNAFQGTGAFFKAHGVAVVAYDQRGFGRSPQRGLWANENNLTSDVAQCVKQVSRRWPRTPIYILGESMGGAVAIAALANPAFKVQGVILSAPAVWGGGTMNPLTRGTLWLAAHTLPFYTLSGRELHIMASNNIPMLRRLSADPLVIKRTRIDAIYGMVQLMDDAYAGIPDVKTPVLLLYGAQDQVIPRRPLEAARARFSLPIEFIYYPDGYHMLLRDLQGETVMRDILGWMQASQKK